MAKKKPIVSPLGQWAYPGEVTIIPSSNITMKGVNYPVLGVDDLGNSQMMMPGKNYNFPGQYVTEYPQMQFGGMSKRKIDKILNKNKDLNFVQRMYQPNTPSIMIPGQQYPSTHFMESADGRVYPTVVQMPDGSLQYLGDNAYDYANQTGQYIEFPNDRQARRFAKSYKKGTGVLQEFGKGGLRQWFAEEWTDVKTGKPCGRSGDEKGSRPYPACRPKNRVNETTPKTTSEMSSAEKAKFKREKTSGKRIDYNHKRREDGGETWLDQYQNAGEVPSNIERMQGVDIKRKKKKVSDSPEYQYDDKGNLLYTPELTIRPYISDNSSRDEFLVNPKLSVQNLNPTLEEFINVASSYYPIDNKLVTDPKINLQSSNYQRSLEQEYVLPQMIGKSFGNLPIVKDDGYSPNRRWVSNLRAKDTAAKFGKDSYAYVLKTNPSNLVDYSTKNAIEGAVSSNDKTLYDYLAKNNYSPDMVFQLEKNRPDQIWNRAEQMRVEMRNNPEIMSWANLHNVDLGYKEKGESDDKFAPKIPESVYANRLVKAGLPTNRPDYEYAPMETYIVQDPSKFNLAGYFPMGSIAKDAEQKVLNKKIPGKLKREYISSNSPEYFEKEAYIKDEMAKRMGINPSAFDSGEYLIHYNQSPITEYTPGKKYGGWLEEYQRGGTLPPIYTSNPNDPRIRSYRDSLNLYNEYSTPSSVIRQLQEIKKDSSLKYYRPSTRTELNNFPGKIKPIIGTEFDNSKLYADLIAGRDTSYSYFPVYDKKGKIIPNKIKTSIAFKKPVQPYIYKKPEVVPEVVETPVASPPVVEPSKPSLFVSNIDRDMYTPGGGMAREYNIGVTLQDGNRKSFRTEKEFQDWKAANNLDISKAKVTEGRGYSYNYPENKKYGGWLDQFQTGGWAGWTPNVGKPYMRTSPAGNAGYTDNTRVVNQNTNVSAANRKAAEAAEYAKRVGSISQGRTKSAYEKAREASSLVAQAEQRKGSADPLDYVLDMVNPATYGFAGADLIGNTAIGVNNLAKGNFSEAAGNAFDAGINALYLLPAAAELRGPLYTGIPKAFVNKSKAELERQAGVDWLRNWYGQPEIKQRFNQQIYNPAVADDLVMPIYKKNVVTDVIEKPNSTINLDKSVTSDFASTMSKEKYAELKYGFKNDPIISLKYGKDIPGTHKKYLGVNSGFGNNMGGYTNVYPEHPEFFYNKFNPNSQWKPTVKGTSIHEGTHWLTTGDEGLAESTKAMFKEPFDLSKRISKQDKYLTKPTEIHARLNELRSQYNLGPTVTQSQVDKIIADGLKGNTTVQKRFFELLKDNKSLTNLFNTAMGISAPLAAASQLPEQKYGGWLNKYK